MWLEQLRRRLAQPKTSVQLCLLGVVAGLIAAFFIILFRLTILFFQSLFLETPDDFTTLPTLERVLMPLIAAFLIASFAAFTGFKHYRLGIPFVIHRIKRHYGQMPFGTIDAYQILMFISGHTERHVKQMEEVKADKNFPDK